MVIIIETISFSEAFKYPFKIPKRLLYILLLIIPIIGWFALFGYIVRLINEFIEGRYEGLIKLDFTEDLKLGFMVFLKALPFYIVYMIILFAAMYVNEAFGNLVNLLLGFFVIPMLAVNFFRKQTVESFFEFDILKVVRDNIGEYIITILKQYALAIIFAVLSIVLIGIPAIFFTNSIFIANMYGRLVEKKEDSSL
ncbi:hypothetical protein MSHOH_2492 [Methanosarcina horonobensis HB-1 = JCM 15518]|uniref:Uncharacterized protein n=1 Tax=Methanosarcina horonobensis HB-1 = JCM 15518 TaxID=1434110 RepID=A0A0E3WW32_9EURY|nr:DUF4013 domain-containing protein [Methanosarcina horonobensis]AKB78975.1 hypothetical protein MSHOH_2492 [Methanosarcina horonobensis HB-1 = JCM 15518]